VVVAVTDDDRGCLPCPADDAYPFEHVTWTRVRGDEGKFTAWVDLLAERQGGERSLRMPIAQLLEQALQQLDQYHRHDTSRGLTEQLEHAMIRAAVAFLMD
jgi:hypothetical protein